MGIFCVWTMNVYIYMYGRWMYKSICMDDENTLAITIIKYSSTIKILIRWESVHFWAGHWDR